MPVRRFAVCDHCDDSLERYEKLRNREATGFKYGDIKESGEAAYSEVEGWTVKAFPDPEDPVVIDFEFYCPECSALDGMFDSGDRVPSQEGV